MYSFIHFTNDVVKRTGLRRKTEENNAKLGIEMTEEEKRVAPILVVLIRRENEPGEII